MHLWFRFVRREKQIATAQSEASEGEALRYKQRVEHQDRELKELQEAVNVEREKMQVEDTYILSLQDSSLVSWCLLQLVQTILCT